MFPKGCFEEPWLQEVILERASVRRTREKPLGAGGALEGAGQEVQASLWTGSEQLGLQMASCVSDLGAEMMQTQRLHSPPRSCTHAPRARAAAPRTRGSAIACTRWRHRV